MVCRFNTFGFEVLLESVLPRFDRTFPVLFFDSEDEVFDLEEDLEFDLEDEAEEEAVCCWPGELCLTWEITIGFFTAGLSEVEVGVFEIAVTEEIFDLEASILRWTRLVRVVEVLFDEEVELGFESFLLLAMIALVGL